MLRLSLLLLFITSFYFRKVVAIRPIQNVSVTPVSSSSARVHWESPHPSVNNYTATVEPSARVHWESPRPSINNYIVTVKPVARRHSPPPGCPSLPPLPSAFNVTVNGPTTETIITLPADLEFQVSVRGESLDVSILSSDVVTGFTLPAVSETVSDLSADVIVKADSVTVTWKAPCDTGGVLSHFMVILEPDRKHQNAHNYILNQTVTQPLQDGFSLTTPLSNLTAECQYDVTVIAVGLSGLYGANRTTSFQVPAREPTQPQNVSVTAVSGSAVRVQWEPPAQSHGTLTFYTVTLQPVAQPLTPTSSLDTAVMTVNGTTLQTVIGHLKDDTDYEVMVTAATLAGQGPPSVVSFVHTPPQEKEPTQPQNVSATAVSDSAVRVQWEPPAQSHGTLTFYTVTLQPVARPLTPTSPLDTAVMTVSGSTLQTIIGHLKDDTDYEVMVTAATSAGQGPPSVVSFVHTPPQEKEPTRPQNVSATAVSGSAVRVQWEPPAQSHGTLTFYTVTLQPVARPLTPTSPLDTAVMTVNGTTLQTVIGHLKYDTDYEVMVTAASSAGQGGGGSPSVVSFVHTPPQEKGNIITVVLALVILVAVVAAGLVLLVTWWVVTQKRKNTNTSACQETVCDKEGLILNDFRECD